MEKKMVFYEMYESVDKWFYQSPWVSLYTDTAQPMLTIASCIDKGIGSGQQSKSPHIQKKQRNDTTTEKIRIYRNVIL